MTNAHIVMLVATALLAGFTLGKRLMLWHLLRCCRCAAHVPKMHDRIHGDRRACCSHGTHEHHGAET